MQQSLLAFIWRHSARQQILLVLLSLAAFPFLYASLELPKKIINEAIGGEGFPVAMPLLGRSLEQIPYLMLLSAIFLGLVLVNGAFKYAVNMYSGRIGERMLRRLRFALFARMLRFPAPHFRKLGQGELVSMVVAETDPLGGFIGNAIRVPVYQGGTLLTILVFMLMQDWVLGLAAISLYPLQSWLIRHLQRRLNALRRQVVMERRRLAEGVGEVAGAVEDVHANGTSRWERARFSALLERMYGLRLDIYRRKFLIKFLNNFIAQVTPFFFYAIGGVLVIRGDLSFGALVAVLAAYKDLNAPWKDLLDYYQHKEDARVKYELLRDTFSPPGMLPEALLGDAGAAPPRLAGELIGAGIDLREERDEAEGPLTTFRVALGRRLAIVGGPGSGARRLGAVLGIARRPLSGRLLVDGEDLLALPEASTGRRIGYAGETPHLRPGSIRENIVYGLRRAPAGPGLEGREALEARLSGCPTDDPDADWLDYEALPPESPDPEARLRRMVLRVVRLVELEDDVYALGLRGRLDPDAPAPPRVAARRRETSERIMRARSALHARLASGTGEPLVEPFDPERFNTNLSVGENLLFGTSRDPGFSIEHLAANAYVRKVLYETGLMEEFLQAGRELAALMVDMFSDVSPDSELFEQFSFIRAEDLPSYRGLVSRTAGGELASLPREDRIMLLSLPFKLVPARHRLGIIDEDMQARILEARKVLARGFGQGAPPVQVFDAGRYHTDVSIQDNILFGRPWYGRARSGREIAQLVREVVEAEGLLEAIVEVGLDAPVGVGGSRLSGAQRQKVALARALLKCPDMLVINHGTSALDPVSAGRIRERLLAEPAAPTIFEILREEDAAALADVPFDQVLRMEGGRVVRAEGVQPPAPARDG